MEETRKPRERNGQGSTVDEAKDELIVRDLRFETALISNSKRAA